MTSSSLKLVADLLNNEQHATLRAQIFTTYLEDSCAGADKIIEFANNNGIAHLDRSEVIAYIDEMDEDDFDVELILKIWPIAGEMINVLSAR